MGTRHSETDHILAGAPLELVTHFFYSYIYMYFWTAGQLVNIVQDIEMHSYITKKDKYKYCNKKVDDQF